MSNRLVIKCTCTKPTKRGSGNFHLGEFSLTVCHFHWLQKMQVWLINCLVMEWKTYRIRLFSSVSVLGVIYLLCFN